jgi:hypothetical protein
MLEMIDTKAAMRERLQLLIEAKENEIWVTLDAWFSSKQFGDRVGEPKILEWANELDVEQGDLKRQLQALS